MVDSKTPTPNSQFSTPPRLVVVVGATASGKTALAIELAQKFDGEIICADSRTVYKHLDIGTAKPTLEERAAVPHHLLDVVEPDEIFTVVDFKRLAGLAIDDISSRGKVPILVGGSGLYIDSVLYDYSFAQKDAARDEVNPRHIQKESAGSRQAMRENTLILGLKLPKEVISKRITERVDAMVDAGLVQETKFLLDNYPASKALDSTGYKAIREYLAGSLNLEEAKALFVQNDQKLAKRQQTWFKRNNSIQWSDNREELVEIATTFLNKNE